MRPLIETNPHLINKDHLKISNTLSAKKSCGVEGIRIKSVSDVHIQIDTSITKAVLNKMKRRLNRD
jgi:hypothetical protein